MLTDTRFSEKFTLRQKVMGGTCPPCPLRSSATVHKDDELVLNYLNDDGRSIEPAWFIPIIPMVLVNGSEGRWTDGSSFIPKYNPRDIIANLKRLLKGEAMVPMHPWYKGFKGDIQKTTSKDTGYTTTGIIIEYKNALSITELPVGTWSQDYKEFLMAASKDGKDIKAYTARYVTDEDFKLTMTFEIIMTEDQMNRARQEGFLNKFKLTTTLSTANMHLLDANGELKKYDTPEQILEDFFHLRLDFYEKRRTALLRELGKASLILENKVRFIREVVEGTIVVNNKKKDNLCAELKDKGFTPFPKETDLTASIAGAVDHVGREENEEEEEVAAGQEKLQGNASKTVPGTEYDYLLSMAIASLTYEKMQKLREERDAKKKEFDELTNTLSKTLWLRDLDALDHQLDEQDKRDAKDEEERKKQQEKARAKGPGGGRKARKPARKPAAKKVTVTPIDAEPMETSGSSPMETGNVPVVPKPRGRAAAGQKKAPAKNKGKATLIDEEDELPLAERMAKRNFQSSQDDDDLVELLARHNIESSPDIAEEAPKKKAPAKRAAAKKKATITEISDDDEEVIEMSDDSDFEVVVAPPEEKKKGGRKPAAAKPSAGAAKKRGAAAGAVSKKTVAGQKLITEVLKPVTAEASPEKKVRKMRPSPFNKKSGSVLGRMNNKDDAIEEDEAMGVGESSGEVAAAKARPQRANKKKMTYVVSDSDEEESEDDNDATEDSDFDDDE